MSARPAPRVDLGNRDSLIRWLQWNDPNGCYSDRDCRTEGMSRLTLKRARLLYFEQRTSD